MNKSICVYILCCIFHWDYHIRTSSFMGFQVVFASSKAFFLNLEEDVLSCAGITKRAGGWRYPRSALSRGTIAHADGKRPSAGYPQPFKRAVAAVNCGFRKTRVVCRRCGTLPAAEGSRRGRPLAEPSAAGSPPGSARPFTRRQLVPPSGTGDYYRFAGNSACIS